MKFSKILLALIAVSFSFALQAQDIITFRSGEQVSVNVEEIGVNSVTYTELDEPDLSISVDKDKIESINMDNGRMYVFEIDQSQIQSVDYDEQMYRAIKIGFLTPTLGSFRVEYEQNIKPGQSMLFTTNLIGLGLDPAEVNPRGMAVSGGYKFMRSPEYYLERQRRAHRMMGSYILVEGNFSGFGQDYNFDYFDNDQGIWVEEQARQIRYGGAITLSYGKQYVFGNRFLVDYSVGLGYSFVSTSYDSFAAKEHAESNYYGLEETGNMYNFTHFSNEVPICFKFRMSIGLLY